VLLEFGMGNFFSFKEGVEVSFKLDANCPQSISGGKEFTPILCVKGANGSGKTHLLKGLAFLTSFCAHSFKNEPDSEIGVSAFFDSKEQCEFYADFTVNGELYRYELSVTEKEIIRETIFRTKKKKVKLLERVGNELTVCTSSLHRLKTMKLRTNASIISIAKQYDFKELDNLYVFFNKVIANVTFSGLSERALDLSTVSQFFDHRPDVFDFVKTFIAQCDVGISNIKVMKRDPTPPETKVTYFPAFIHKVNGADKPVTAYTESSGTKALYRALAAYRLTLDNGGLLILDEFDINLHPHILPKLLELFLNPEINTLNAQMIFSTHNSEVLNSLGRYRTFLVNKHDNESFGYRLDELPGDIVRNDRPILNAYNEGKIGGIPKL
jgi:uncharacterized protein